MVCNHPSWWDPITANLVHDAFFPGHRFYAPIDAVALEQYQILKRLGFFGIDGSLAGVKQFLSVAAGVLKSPAVLWLTPEGRFADPRDQAAELMPGVSHLAARLPDAVVLTMALEYPFFDERLPNMLCRIGNSVQPVVRDEGGGPRSDKSSWSAAMNVALRGNQERLATAVMRRSFEGFSPLFAGSATPGSAYDWARAAKQLLSGRGVRLRHGKS